MNSKSDHVHVLNNKLQVPLFNNYPYKCVPKNPVDIVSRLTWCRPGWPPRCRRGRSRWGRCTSAASPAASAPAPPRRWGTDQSELSVAATLHQSQLTWLAWMWVSMSPGIRNWDGDSCSTSAAPTSCLRVAQSGSAAPLCVPTLYLFHHSYLSRTLSRSSQGALSIILSSQITRTPSSALRLQSSLQSTNSPENIASTQREEKSICEFVIGNLSAR